jgi:hypothetical protein
MEPFSLETLTILTLTAFILSVVTFITVLILICIKYYHSNTINPVDTRSITSSDSHLSSVSPTKRKEQSFQSHKYHPDSISIIYERPSNNQNKHQQDNDETTIRSESRVYIQRHQQQQRFKPITDVEFLDRHTPYPPDVLAREQIMMNHLQFSKK